MIKWLCPSNGPRIIGVLFKLVCVVLGLTMQDFEDYKTMNQNRSKALAQNFDRYLKEEKAAGRTVMDKDAAGNEFEMTMGPLI